MRKRHITERFAEILALLAALALLPTSSVLAAQSGQNTRQAAEATPTPRPKSLGDIARNIKLQPIGKGVGGAAGAVVITDSNLKEYAAKGSLTTASRQPLQRGGAAATTQAQTGAQDELKRRSWRSMYQRQAQLINSIKARIKELDESIPGLWRQFYSWDDPAYRDGVIKPKLDKFLNERNELAKRLPQEEAKLPEILDRARRDGALPGWFRDLVKP
jgi:hypothetical protein